MKSPVELNSLLSKFFCYITWFVIPLLDYANEAFTSNPIASSKQKLSGLKITNWKYAERNSVDLE